jgi:hypothetical protein
MLGGPFANSVQRLPRKEQAAKQRENRRFHGAIQFLRSEGAGLWKAAGIVSGRTV